MGHHSVVWTFPFLMWHWPGGRLWCFVNRTESCCSGTTVFASKRSWFRFHRPHLTGIQVGLLVPALSALSAPLQRGAGQPPGSAPGSPHLPGLSHQRVSACAAAVTAAASPRNTPVLMLLMTGE